MREAAKAAFAYSSSPALLQKNNKVVPQPFESCVNKPWARLRRQGDEKRIKPWELEKWGNWTLWGKRGAPV